MGPNHVVASIHSHPSQPAHSQCVKHHQGPPPVAYSLAVGSACPSPPSLPSTIAVGESPSHLHISVVNCQWGQGRAGWAPNWTRVPLEKEDPSSIQSIVSGPVHGGGDRVAPLVPRGMLHTKHEDLIMPISNGHCVYWRGDLTPSSNQMC